MSTALNKALYCIEFRFIKSSKSFGILPFLKRPEMHKLLHKHFPNIVEQDLQDTIVRVGEIKKIPAGMVIQDIGKFIRMVPMLYKGAIKVMREDEEGNEVFLYYLNPGETCAMSLTCCNANKPSTICAIAEEDVEMIGIPVRCMDEWMMQYHSWKDFVMQTYSNRFEELLKAVDSLAFQKMDERLLKYLQDKANVTGKTLLEVTHGQIASELNSSREVISRLLKQLENTGKVKGGRNKIQLLV
jgi:CRP/FNR family transcriptional regulator